jgi:ubiquinone/menaquinone biosynthesis C-methylase UbiE
MSHARNQEIQMNERRMRVLLLPLALLIGAVILARPASAQTDGAAQAPEQSIRPDVNEGFLDPELNPEEWVDRFETESREVFRSRAAIEEAIGLKEGVRVADIGAGTGLFTTRFAERVGPSGWVYAVEIAPRFVERIGKLADQRDLGNISPMLGSETSVRLPPESIDVAFTCDTYHHFEYPQSTLASIHRALRQGGRLIVVDFQRIDGVSREWVLGHVRAGKSVVRKEIEAAGFEFVGESQIEGLLENYFITFRKTSE